MAVTPSESDPTAQLPLPQILKAIRRRRGLTTPEVAKAMGMAVRS
jgi:hypothetical protein